MYKFILFALQLLTVVSSAEIFPNSDVFSAAQEVLHHGNAKVTDHCTRQLNHVITSVLNLEIWALTMVDAASKIPTGILSGNIRDLGNFDECMSIDENSIVGNIKGKHCVANLDTDTLMMGVGASVMLSIGASGMPAMWSLCVPDSCSASDLNEVVSYLSHSISNKIPLNFSESNCYSKATEPELETGAKIVIIFFGIMLLLAVISTGYDVFTYYANIKPFHFSLLAFSVLSNGRKLFSTNTSKSQLLCLNGLRTISMMWVILGHLYAYRYPTTSVNTVNVLEFMLSTDSTFILSGTIAVDSFFVIGGVVLSYVFLNTMDKGEKFNLPIYYIHRYLRLTPALLAVILVEMTLLRHISSGPLVNSSEINVLMADCQNWWWTTLLYVQNYVNGRNQCVPVSWYLAVDMQLYILSPIILFPLRKWPKNTMLGILLLCFGITAGVFVIAWHFKLVGLGFGATAEQIENMFNYYYVQTHTRAIPWLLGLIVGYFIYYYKKSKIEIPINKVINYILWTLSLVVMATCAFCGHNLVTDEYQRWLHTIYITFIRTVWSTSLCWIIFACVFGYGGPIDWFLSLPLFQVISKFTYTMYLLHVTIICIITASTKSPVYFSPFQMMFDFWGFFWLTFGLAIIWSLLFESPIIIIEKLIFDSKSSNKNNAKNGKTEENICVKPDV